MKLIGCYVRNFGTLNDYEYKFSDGLTVIKEDNGFGKSTLAAFIKVMLYGLPKRAGLSIDTNERKRFAPWQGGVFGGTLDFEVDGKKYRVERTFGDREKQDTFKLIDLDSGEISDRFSSSLGVELFSMDSVSFERTVYTSQLSASTEMTDDINSKLAGLIESGDNDNGFDEAMKALEKRIKFYTVANGARGEIADRTRQIDELKRQINDMTEVRKNIADREVMLKALSERAEELDKKLQETREKITAASDKAARESLLKQRSELESEIKSLKNTLATITAKYPDGIPSEDECKLYTDANKLLKEFELKSSVLSEGEITDKEEYDSLSTLFKGGVPSDAEMAEYGAVADELQKVCIKADLLKEQLGTQEDVGESKKGKFNVKLSFLFAAVVVIFGAAALLKWTAVGIILLTLGVLCLGASAFIYLKNMITQGQSGANEVERELETVNFRKNALEARLSEFTQRFIPEASPLEAFGNIKDSTETFKRVSASIERSRQGRLQMESEVGDARLKCEAFVKKYANFFAVGDDDVIMAISRDRAEKERVSSLLDVKREKLAQLPDVVEAETESVTESREQLMETEGWLLAQLTSANQRITSLKLEVDRMNAMSEALPDLEQQLDRLTEERDVMVANLNVLNLTTEFLENAKQSLSERYLDRVVNRFKHYCEVLGVAESDVLVDRELTVLTNVSGGAREKGYFSQGVKDMLDIAMRLSLNDALFSEESSFIILDDPFVNLDDKRVAKALKLLEVLSHDRQIIYLTCHSSRC